jgi:FkbH-like protein
MLISTNYFVLLVPIKLMQRTINITCSSNLLANTSYWDNLKNDYKLNFSDYGDFKNTLLKSDKNASVCFFLFLKDIFKNCINDKQRMGVLKIIFQLLESRLNKSNDNLLFFYSAYEKFNIIDKLTNSDKKNLYNYKIIKKLNLLKRKYKNFISINMDEIFSDSGFNENFDERNWYLAKCHLSSQGIVLLTDTIKKIFDKINLPSKKLLILDCDNTLWGGVVGEDGYDKIKLGDDGIGQAFVDFQSIILNLKQQGTLLAISSKNIETDVLDVLKKNQKMILKKNDFISLKVNWNEKYKNIIEISDELGLSLDSFVFWDDNPVERSKVKRFTPEVEVIEPPEDVSLWPSLLKSIEYFSKIKLTKEDLKKHKQYKQRSKFVLEKNNSADESQYLKSINLNISSLNISSQNLSRASQLTLKTNQFNLTTKRYNEIDIKKINQDKNSIIKLISLKDIYGDHGIVGLYIIKKINTNTSVIDTFLMSCRILGRYLENYMIKLCIDDAKKLKSEKLFLTFIKTKKNYFCEKFISDLNLIKFSGNQKLLQTKGDLYEIPLKKQIKIKYLEVYEKK